MKRNERHTTPDLLDGYVLTPLRGHWRARLMVAGRMEEHDTGAVTRAGAEDWLRAARAQVARAGTLYVTVTVRADEVP